MPSWRNKFKKKDVSGKYPFDWPPERFRRNDICSENIVNHPIIRGYAVEVVNDRHPEDADAQSPFISVGEVYIVERVNSSGSIELINQRGGGGFNSTRFRIVGMP